MTKTGKKTRKTDSTYLSAGVNVDAGNRFVEMLKPFAKATNRPGVVGGIGGFGGFFSINPSKYKEPILVSSSDGVGTKLKIAFMTGKHDTIGIDLVAMNVNDIVAHGAEPLFFLDYLASGKLDVDKSVEIIKGISAGCIEAGCALLGGETAEMPSFYSDGDYDLAGFAVGIAEREKIIDGHSVNVSNKIIGLASSGLHSNGFSLVRKVIFDNMKLGLDSVVPELGCTVAEELLRPTRIYVKTILHIVKDFKINGIAHITGGGFIDNPPRVFPDRCSAVFNLSAFEWPPIFKFLMEKGPVTREEMLRTFNCGVGMVMIVMPGETDAILDRLRAMGEKAWVIGEITERKSKDEPKVRFTEA